MFGRFGRGFLLDADVDLELSTAHPASTPLHIACCAGYVDLVELLLARQAQADRGGGAEGGAVELPTDAQQSTQKWCNGRPFSWVRFGPEAV